MKKFNSLFLIIFPLFLSINGCTYAKISGKGAIPLLLNNPAEKISPVSHFKESKMVIFDYTGSFDVYEVIADRLEASDADMATNITISIKSDIGTFFVNLITLGLANARTFDVSGDLVKRDSEIGSLMRNHEILGVASNVDELKHMIRDLAFSGKAIRNVNIMRKNGKFMLLTSH